MRYTVITWERAQREFGTRIRIQEFTYPKVVKTIRQPMGTATREVERNPE